MDYKVSDFTPPEITPIEGGRELVFHGYHGQYVYSCGPVLQFTHADSNGRTGVYNRPGDRWVLVEPSPLETHYASHEDAYKAIVRYLNGAKES